MSNPTAQWRGDNLAEIQTLLRRHDAVAEKYGDQVLITGEGLALTLNLGDQVVVSGDQLGVIRPATKTPDPEVTWTGDNVFEMSRFLSDFEVRCELFGRTLFIHDLQGREKPARLDPGDKIISRNGTPVVSKAGQHHRLQ
jgi:hypothetical protein